MDQWLVEVIELHDCFEEYITGTIDSLERAEVALAADFTMVAPSGDTSSRSEVITEIEDAHARLPSLKMTITHPELLFEDDATLVAAYVENQQYGEGSNRRRATVVFVKDDSAPNGLLWHRIHETWLSPAG